MSKLKNRGLLVTSAVVLVTLIGGCSNDEKKESAALKTATASGIEVSKNENASEIKVEEKKHSKDDKQYYFDYNVKSAYSSNATPANEDASVRIKPKTAVDANLHVRSPYENVQISLLVKGLSKKFIVRCSACHNDYANGVVGPSLLGKSSDFIFDKIKKFKDDRNANILMSDLVKNMEDKEIRELADEINRFNNEIKEMRSK
jgi:cytochrome c553